MKRLQNLLTLNFILFQLTDILRDMSFQIFPLKFKIKKYSELDREDIKDTFENMYQIT